MIIKFPFALGSLEDIQMLVILVDPDEIPCPDPTKPEEMEKPIPVFIDVTSCEKMKNIYSYSPDTLAIAVAVNAPNPDRISDLLAYLFE